MTYNSIDMSIDLILGNMAVTLQKLPCLYRNLARKSLVIPSFLFGIHVQQLELNNKLDIEELAEEKMIDFSWRMKGLLCKLPAFNIALV